MANNYLITGYWGEPHVTPENDRGFNAAVFGPGRFVLPVGEQFRAEYIGNNTVRIHDGKLMDNGALAGIPAGTYVDLLIPEAGQGMNRSDLIVFQYDKDPNTLVESGQFIVLTGEESAGTAYDPALTQQDILTDTATIDQMPLWRVTVSGAVINAPAQMFTVRSASVTLKTLWENPDTSAAFPNQAIPLGVDVSQYSMFIIGVLPATLSAGTQGTPTFFILPRDLHRSRLEMMNGNGYVSRFATIYYDTNSIYFNSGMKVTFTGSTATSINSDEIAIPLVIYGLCGNIM